MTWTAESSRQLRNEDESSDGSTIGTERKLDLREATQWPPPNVTFPSKTLQEYMPGQGEFLAKALAADTLSAGGQPSVGLLPS